MALFLEHFEPTEEGEMLDGVISQDIQDKCRMVYEYNKDIEGYAFKAFWSPNGVYEEEDVVLPFRSTYGGLFPSDGPITFVNVIESDGDTYDDNTSISWMDALSNLYKDYNEKNHTNFIADMCCTDGIFYDGSLHECGRIFCGDKIVGAHIFMDTVPTRLLPGSDVDIVPICKLHHTSQIPSKRIIDDHQGGYYPGTDYVMKTKKTVLILRMNGYKPVEKVQEYLYSYGVENVARI